MANDPIERPRSGVGALLAGLALLLALLLAGSAAVTTYTIRPGDTLSGVGARFGVSASALAAANHISDPNAIGAGHVLVIPDASPSPGRGGAPGRLPAALVAHPARLALRPFFRYWSAAYDVPPYLVEGLAWMESGWQATAVSRTGAIGIGQLEPSTVAFVCAVLLHTSLNPRLAEANIRMTARYLRYLLDQTHGNVGRALAGYYQGLRSVDSRGPFPATYVYVVSVLGLSASFRPG